MHSMGHRGWCRSQGLCPDQETYNAERDASSHDKRKHAFYTPEIGHACLPPHAFVQKRDDPGWLLDDASDEVGGVAAEPVRERTGEDRLLDGGSDRDADDLSDRAEEVTRGNGQRRLGRLNTRHECGYEISTDTGRVGRADSLRREVMTAPPPRAPTAISTQRRFWLVSGPQENMIEMPWIHGISENTNWNHLYSLKCCEG